MSDRYFKIHNQLNLVPLHNQQERSAHRAYEIIREFTCENSRKASCSDLVYFQAWLTAIGFSFDRQPNEEEILAFIVQHAEGLDPHVDAQLVALKRKSKLGPHKLATIKRRIVSISVFFDAVGWENHCKKKSVKQLLYKLTKKYGRSKPAGKAITKDILDAMLATCGSRLIDLRDCALLLFAWASGGRRRSEVIAAQLENLTTFPDGTYIYQIPSSKTDQEGQGHSVPIQGRAAQALQAWLAKADIRSGHIFRAVNKKEKVGNKLSPIDVYRIVRRRLKRAGYNEKQFGAHSLRSGFVTTAGRHGKPIGDVMQMTTHRSVSTVLRYYQAGNVKNNSAANLAD